MAQFIYALPGDEPVTEERLEKVGLLDRFEGPWVETWQTRGATVSVTDDGELCNRGAEDGRVQRIKLVRATVTAKVQQAIAGEEGPTEQRDAMFSPEKQTWHSPDVPEGQPQYWVGLWDDAPPHPQELWRRPAPLGEYWMPLGDGNQWNIPAGRKHDGSTDLPCKLTLSCDGEEQQEIKREYRDIFERLEPFAQEWFPAAEEELEEDEGEDRTRDLPAFPLKLCVDLLKLNYRIGAPEALNLLGLVTSENRHLFMMAALDIPGLQQAMSDMSEGEIDEEQAKKGVKSDELPSESGADSADAQTSSGGSEDSMTATPQAGQSTRN